jgi:hypothetical protein
MVKKRLTFLLLALALVGLTTYPMELQLTVGNLPHARIPALPQLGVLLTEKLILKQ